MSVNMYNFVELPVCPNFADLSCVVSHVLKRLCLCAPISSRPGEQLDDLSLKVSVVASL